MTKAQQLCGARMGRVWFLSIAIFFCSNVFAQQGQYQDVIYLKNGSVVKGMITEFAPTKSYTIKTADGSIFVFKVEEIEKIAKELIPNSANSNRAINSDSFVAGYRGVIEGGFGASSGSYGLNTVCFAISNGYQFNKKLYAGIATGLNYYPSSVAGVDGFGLIPLYLDGRYSFLPKNPVSPYASLGAGFSFDPQQSFEGAGGYLNPSVGAQIAVGNKYKINLGFNYRIQQMYFTNIVSAGPGGIVTERVIRFSESAGFAIGFVF